MDLHLIHIEIKYSGTHFCNRVDNILHSTQNTNPFSKEKESAVAAHVTKSIQLTSGIAWPGPLRSWSEYGMELHLSHFKIKDSKSDFCL